MTARHKRQPINFNEAIEEEKEKYNFKIQFIEETWVLKQEGGGFCGRYNTKAALIKPEPFGVLKVTKDKHKQCSDIWVWSDGFCDGTNCFLINVPNGLFKQIEDVE